MDPQDNPLKKPPQGGAPAAPAAPMPGGGAPAAPAGGGALPPPEQRAQMLTPQEMQTLDQAFTPEVLRILIKVFPDLMEPLKPFLEMQESAQQMQPGPTQAPSTGLGQVQIGK